jgi:inhibitor of cysteine peptidase
MVVIRIDQGHNGATVPAKVGDTIEVVLPEHATTGFQWEVGTPGETLTVEKSELVPPDDARAGAAAVRHVVARAVRSGHGHLSLRLRRSWDPPDKAEDTFGVDIDVT